MNTPQHVVEVSDQQTLPVDQTQLIQVAERILTDHGYHSAELSIAVVDDPAIHRLNKQYLNHDYETDVLSFILDHDDDAGMLSGQLIVSAETAAREAVDAGWSLQTELLLYVVHGTLHLVGFDDKDPEDARKMREAEARYLSATAKESQP